MSLKVLQILQKIRIFIRILMQKQQDGWEEFSQGSEQNSNLISIYKQNQGRNILHKQYSLEPDMLTGWMPKLPSCPIPLTYQNKTIEQVEEKLSKQSLYDVIYKGTRHINSVQLHKSYNYTWKYRSRYDVKVNIIADAINNIGLVEENDKKYIYTCLQKNKDNEIAFDSNFESGNLDLVVKIKKNEYDCFLRSDTNTRGHTNWYYFKVNNKNHTGIVQFNICNIVKKKNLYGKGMNPYTKLIQPCTKSNNWTQNQCYDTQFVERLCRYGTGKTSNQLQFKFQFPRENMEVYFAYSIPYTYSDLNNLVQEIKDHPLVKISTICESFSGLDLPLITIADQSSHKKSSIILTARIHPGETNSSHMLEGFIKSLLENNSLSHRLISICNFYIIPFMNPDGVVVGNYRTSFSGRDLNRKFDEIGNFLYPEINGLIHLVKKLKKQRQRIDFFFDFHSHSSKKNLFCYGPDHRQDSPAYLRSKVFVKILKKQDSMFDDQKCISWISEYKKTTARAHMLRKESIPMTYTFQISNGLYNLTKDLQSTYDVTSLNRAGKIIFKGLSQYSIFYLRQFQFYKSNRLSLNLTKKIPALRKVAIRRSQNLQNSIQYLSNNNHELKDIIEEITQQKEIKYVQEQIFSDNEQSQNDVDDKQLKELFDIRKKYISDFQHSINDNARKRGSMGRKGSPKTTITPKESFIKNQLSRAISQKILVKSNQNLHKKLQTSLNSPVMSTSKVGKYIKNRIYYEETHPPLTKKTTQNTNPIKKAIKQKKFPIIF